MIEFEKEKSHLTTLPASSIRDSYKITHKTVKVNASNMISYKSSQYSVPSGYYGKKVSIQIIDNQLWVYFNMKIIAQHVISSRKLNYRSSHYREALEGSTNKFLDIDELARQNLQIIGEVFE